VLQVLTLKAIVTGAEGQHLFLSPHTAALCTALEWTAAEWQGHQGVDWVNVFYDAHLCHFFSVEAARTNDNMTVLRNWTLFEGCTRAVKVSGEFDQRVHTDLAVCAVALTMHTCVG
jgi:hypothetical protein